MAGIWRRVCAMVNPVSTAFSRWWCHSALRHMLTGHRSTGYGPTARQRRIRRSGAPVAGPWTRGTVVTPSAKQMEARRRAIDDLLSRDNHAT
jgi:hypothetical protein